MYLRRYISTIITSRTRWENEELLDEAVICPNCGCPVEEKKTNDNNFTAKTIAYCAIVVGIIATVLPFFKLAVLGGQDTVTLWDGDYKYLTAFGVIVSIILAFVLMKNKKSMRRDTIFVGIVIVFEIVFQYVMVRKRIDSNELIHEIGFDLNLFFSPESGFYLMVLSGIMLFVAGSMMKISRGCFCRDDKKTLKKPAVRLWSGVS